VCDWAETLRARLFRLAQVLAGHRVVKHALLVLRTDVVRPKLQTTARVRAQLAAAALLPHALPPRARHKRGSGLACAALRGWQLLMHRPGEAVAEAATASAARRALVGQRRGVLLHGVDVPERGVAGGLQRDGVRHAENVLHALAARAAAAVDEHDGVHASRQLRLVQQALHVPPVGVALSAQVLQEDCVGVQLVRAALGVHEARHVVLVQHALRNKRQRSAITTWAAAADLLDCLQEV